MVTLRATVFTLPVGFLIALIDASRPGQSVGEYFLGTTVRIFLVILVGLLALLGPAFAFHNRSPEFRTRFVSATILVTSVLVVTRLLNGPFPGPWGFVRWDQWGLFAVSSMAFAVLLGLGPVRWAAHVFVAHVIAIPAVLLASFYGLLSLLILTLVVAVGPWEEALEMDPSGMVGSIVPISVGFVVGHSLVFLLTGLFSEFVLARGGAQTQG